MVSVKISTLGLYTNNDNAIRKRSYTLALDYPVSDVQFAALS